MKKSILTSVAVAVLLFSGCSSKDAAVDTDAAQQETIKEAEVATPVDTEAVNSDMQAVEGGMETADTNEVDIMDIQSKYQTVYFDFDKYDIRPDMQEVVNVDADIAKDLPSGFKVKLEGNCDEWGSDEYNFALGLKRAKSVKEAFIANGVEADNISMVSYGESNPVCEDHTKECWAKNRRVDIKVLP
jgi:peptidoglycan-associated lipoprotein